MASLLAIHSCSLAAPILIGEARTAGIAPSRHGAVPHAGQQQDACGRPVEYGLGPVLALDPEWTDEFMAGGVAIYASGLFSPKEVELLSIAFDASFTHMYAPGTRRHIKGALAAGASVEEIMEVLKLCVVQGVQALNLALPILAEELERADQEATGAKP